MQEGGSPYELAAVFLRSPWEQGPAGRSKGRQQHGRPARLMGGFTLKNVLSMIKGGGGGGRGGGSRYHGKGIFVPETVNA